MDGYTAFGASITHQGSKQTFECPAPRAVVADLDVISVNYYRAWSPNLARLAQWTKESGRPVLITEWYAKALDTGLANTSGAGWLVKTQEEEEGEKPA